MKRLVKEASGSKSTHAIVLAFVPSWAVRVSSSSKDFVSASAANQAVITPLLEWPCTPDQMIWGRTIVCYCVGYCDRRKAFLQATSRPFTAFLPVIAKARDISETISGIVDGRKRKNTCLVFSEGSNIVIAKTPSQCRWSVAGRWWEM